MTPERGVVPWLAGLTLSLCFLLAGCATRGPGVDQKLQGGKPPPAEVLSASTQYRVGCLDALECFVPNHPEWSGTSVVNGAGCIQFTDRPRIHVDGMTPTEIAEVLARATGVSAGEIQVRVVQFNSKQIFLLGEVKGQPRAIPYEGPETVLALLQRVGITPGASANNIVLVRGNVAEGGSPEVFNIDLIALLKNSAPQNNPTLQPFDEIYIAQTRKCRVEQCVPPWLRPLYESLCGLSRPHASHP